MNESETLTEADQAFLAFLDSGGTGEDAEAFVARHPHLRGALNRKIQAYRLMQRVFFAIRQEVENASLRDGPIPALERKRLGDFEIMKVLGRGGFGVVFLAKQVSLQREVAFKVLHPSLMGSPRARERFLREGRAVARLRHPGIVSVHTIGEAEGYAYLAMDRVLGVGLDDLLAVLKKRDTPHLRATDYYESLAEQLQTLGGALAMPQADRGGNYFQLIARLLRDVARAIHHAHTMGVVHRDLKPSNILIDGNAAPQLIDFGLNLTDGLTPLTLSSELFGSVPYMPPEQIQSPGKFPAEAGDVYGLGITLYEALTLHPAFKADNVARTFKLIVQNTPPAPHTLQPSIPKDLEAITLKAFDSDPGRRYPSAQAFADDLDRFLDGVPVQARPRPWYSTLWKKYRRDRRVLVLAAALLAFGVQQGWRQYTAHAIRNKALAESHFLAGLAKGSTSLYADALKEFSQAIRKNPGYLLAYVERALTRMILSQDLEAARRDLDRALKLDPESGDAKAVLSILEYRQGRVKDADRLHREVMNGFPVSEHIGNVYIEQLRVRKMLHKAIAGLMLSAQNDPSNVQTRLWLGYLLNGERQFARALVPLDEALTLNPKRAELWIQKFRAHKGLNQRFQALRAIQNAVDLIPNDGRSRIGLAMAFEDIGNHEKAIQEYRIATALMPMNPKLYGTLGYALLETARHEEAVEAFKRGIELGLSDAGTYSSLAVCLNIVGRHQEAARYFELAARKEPTIKQYRQWAEEARARPDGAKLMEQGETVDGQHYRHDRYGLSMTFPKGWIFDPDPMNADASSRAFEKDEPYTPRLTVNVTDDPKEVHKTFEMEQSETEKLGWKQTLESETPYSVSGLTGVQQTGRLFMGQYHLSYVRIRLIHDGRLYDVTGLAKDDEFSKWMRDFSACLTSIRIKK